MSHLHDHFIIEYRSYDLCVGSAKQNTYNSYYCHNIIELFVNNFTDRKAKYSGSTYWCLLHDGQITL